MTQRDRAQQVRERYQARKALGLCPVCGASPDIPGKRCGRCAAANDRAKEAMKQRGGCQVCGNLNATSSRCEDCRKRRKEYHANKVQQGLCYCGSVPDPGRRSCGRCLARGRSKLAALRIETIQAYGGMCACCGETLIQFLQIDHIDGRRTEGIRDEAFGSALYSRLRKEGWPSGFQVLCANCNFAKGMYSRCPHIDRHAGSVVAGLGVAVSGN